MGQRVRIGNQEFCYINKNFVWCAIMTNIEYELVSFIVRGQF